MTFFPGASSENVDLTPPPERDSDLPPSDAKVYLVPLGPPKDVSLDWAQKYFKAKLGIEVEVLPPLALDDSVNNWSRNQAIAEELVKTMVKGEPSLAGDPSAVLLGVTAKDIYIREYDWKYAVNYRAAGRAGVVSLARLQPSGTDSEERETLLLSRLQKMLVKNIAILAFGVPQSGDDTSSVAFSQNTPDEIDRMTENLVGAVRHWESASLSYDPMVTAVSKPGQPLRSTLRLLGDLQPDTSSEMFSADLRFGMFIQRRTDFNFDEPQPLVFTRVYRTQDPQSRPFGIGANDSLDMFLSGQMGSWIDLIREDGSRFRYERSSKTAQIYKPDCDCTGFSHSKLEFIGDVWHLRTDDGWEYLFPYRPELGGAKVTILTGINGPKGQKFEMVRDVSGDLVRVTTPLGSWLRFENDEQHRITSIVDSRGKRIDYAYDTGSRLNHVRDSSGNEESYAYDASGRMVRIVDGSGTVILENKYDGGGDLTQQVLGDGEVMQYEYTRDAPDDILTDRFTDSSGWVSEFKWSHGNFRESLPTPVR